MCHQKPYEIVPFYFIVLDIYSKKAYSAWKIGPITAGTPVAPCSCSSLLETTEKKVINRDTAHTTHDVWA